MNPLDTVSGALPRTVFCLAVFALSVSILSGYRAWLCHERGDDLRGLSAGDKLKLFWIGFRLDALIVSRALLILAVALLVAPAQSMALVRPIVLAYAGLLFFLLFLAETAGVYFFRYYDFRPNYLVLEHGMDKEVLKTILKIYPVAWIVLVSAAGAAAALFFAWQVAPAEAPTAARFAPLPDLVGTSVLLLLGGVAARGGFDHRPLNPSAAAISGNRIANEIAACGIFNVLYEWAQQKQRHYGDLKSVIEPLPVEEATRRASSYLATEGTLTDDSPNPLVRWVEGREEDKPLNVVLVVMESFTSRLVGALGGAPALTPELDRLIAEGVIFENCYATGERTIQALEAAVASFPPLPGVSVVRRPEAQSGFATLASVLKERGYATLFLYGGQGIFDHMRSFFLGNGFDRFIEEKDFTDVEFRGSWGVSDEDLFRRADGEFRNLAERGRPFFATLLTVSLHSPWEYPPGRITPLSTDVPVPPGFEYEELNNFLYADYAVGRFMREARRAPYFDDTLFVFVGDHGVHLRGRDLIPVDEYRVPALFLAPSRLAPRRIRRVTSQIDIPATIMDVAGGGYRSTFFGKNVLGRENDDGLAIMIYNKKRYAVVSGDNLTVLTEGREEMVYERSSAGWKRAAPDHASQSYSRDAIALLQTAEQLLKTGRYTTARSANSTQPHTGNLNG